MTVLTFPTNPINGQRYSAPNGIQYVYDGVKWVVETTSSSGEAITNAMQDRVAPMFVDGDNTGITFTYNATTNVMSASVTSVNGSQLVNGDSSFSVSSDGTLTLTHPPESDPIVHPLSTVLTVQKAAGNYHTISGAYGLSLQATPVPSGFGLNTNTNFVDIFHDGISVNVNDNTWTFGTDGTLTLPTGAEILIDTPGSFAVSSTSGMALFDNNSDPGSMVEGDLGEVAFFADVNSAQNARISLVKMSATPGEPVVLNWTFDTDGALTLPNDSSIESTSGNGIGLTTDRGTILFGNSPEQCTPTQASHFHIMKDDPTTVDLFFGDDYNYLKLPNTGGVEISSPDVVSVSSGMGDRSNWIMTTNANDGNIGNLQPSNAWTTSVAYDSQGNTFSSIVYGGPIGGPGDPPGMSLTKTDPNGQVMFSNFYNERYAFGWSMIVDKNDDVVFVMAEFDAPSTDTVLVKVSGEDGTFMWQKYLADTDAASDDVALCVDIDPQNNVIIAGTTATGSPGPGAYDFWVAKFNGVNGMSMWQRQYDSDGCQDSASGIAVDSQGNIGLVGTSFGPGQFLAVFKIDGFDGGIMWQKRVINAELQSEDWNLGNAWVNGDLYSSDICVDSNDDFYFNLTGVYCTAWTIAGIHKISSTGDWKWSKVVSYSFFSQGSSSLTCDSNNNVYLTSTLSGFQPVNQQTSPDPIFATVITKFNAAGRKIWGKSLRREQSDAYAGGGAGSQGELIGVGQTVAVNDDYILVGGGYFETLAYSVGNQHWYNKSFLAQLDKSGTDFVKDGWVFKDNEFKIFNMSLATDDNSYIIDLTNNMADIVVTPGSVTFSVNTDTYNLAYINTARVKTMTLDGASLHLPENGALALKRKQIGHITSIGKFDLDGAEGNNIGGDTYINGVASDGDGNIYAAGGWRTRNETWNDGLSSRQVPLIWKIDSEGSIVWSAGNNLDQWGADMVAVAHHAATDTIIALGMDNEDSLNNFDGAEGFNLFTLDAGSGTLKSVLHVQPSVAQPSGSVNSGADMSPSALALKSDGSPVVVGYINNNYDKFENVTGGSAGLAGSAAGILVINKSVFDRPGTLTDIEYPNGAGYWYIDNSAIQYVNRYAGLNPVRLTGVGVDATFTVTANPATNAYTVVKSAGGSGYANGDTVKVLGSVLGGVDGVNDCLITITNVIDGAVDTITFTGTGQTTKIKLDVGTAANFTVAGTYNVWHYTDGDAFIWTPDWHVSVGGEAGYDSIDSVTVDIDDNIVVGGRSFNLNLGNETTNWGSYAQRGFIAKYNSAGVRQWAKSVDGHEGDSTVWGVVTDTDKNVYGVMATNYYASGQDPHVIKLDSNGNFVWLTQLNYYNYYFDTISIAMDADENIIVSSSYQSSDTYSSRVGNDTNNIQIAKFDKDGNLLFQRLLWSNNGMYTGYNDWYGGNLTVAGDKMVWGGFAATWNGNNDDTAVVAQLPVDGSGIGNIGNYYYDEVEITINRWTENNTFGGDVLIVCDVSDRLPTRDHVLVSAPYGAGQAAGDPTGSGYFVGASGPLTIYASNLTGKVEHIFEPGGADITGVKEIVFEDGTRQSTTAQDIPQVDFSITNRQDDDYWLRLEDRGHHIYMTYGTGVDIVIPSFEQVPFPVGTSIVIVTGDDVIDIYSYNDNDLMHAAGLDSSSYSWRMPRWSMATLLKIKQGYNSDGTPTNSCDWMIAGPGLTAT